MENAYELNHNFQAADFSFHGAPLTDFIEERVTVHRFNIREVGTHIHREFARKCKQRRPQATTDRP